MMQNGTARKVFVRKCPGISTRGGERKEGVVAEASVQPELAPAGSGAEVGLHQVSCQTSRAGPLDPL